MLELADKLLNIVVVHMECLCVLLLVVEPMASSLVEPMANSSMEPLADTLLGYFAVHLDCSTFQTTFCYGTYSNFMFSSDFICEAYL